MVPVASLLNPLPASFERAVTKSPIPISVLYTSALQPAKKPKMSKAAATFVKGKPKGDVNYPPFELEDLDEATEAAYERFDVRPVGQISEYPKRIPYNSEKKSFQQKTGRSGFEGIRRAPTFSCFVHESSSGKQSTNTHSECQETIVRKTPTR